jgi:CheY-like chemotaxis protein
MCASRAWSARARQSASISRRRRSAAPPVVAAEGEAPRGAGETILIVEDDADVRAAVAAMVSDLGYGVIEADGPEQALCILAEQPVALVFSDVVMPGPITSRQLAERARALQPRAKVLFTSGYTQNRSTTTDSWTRASS